MWVLFTWLIASVAAYDLVLFSNEQQLSAEYPSMDSLLSAASAKAPVLFLLNPDFTLGQFSQAVSAYSANAKLSGLASIAKSSKSSTSRSVNSPVYIANAARLSKADDFKSGSTVYVLNAADYASLDEMATSVLSKIGSNYVAVLADSEFVTEDKTRVKRVAMQDDSGRIDRAAANGPTTQKLLMPVVLPPFNVSGVPPPEYIANRTCLFYLEGLDLLVISSNRKVKNTGVVRLRADNITWGYGDGFFDCGTADNHFYPNQTVFTVSLSANTELKNDDLMDKDGGQPMSFSGDLQFKLMFGGMYPLSGKDYWLHPDWGLVDAAVDKLQVTYGGKDLIAQNPADKQSLQLSDMTSVPNSAYGCSGTPAIFFPTNDPALLLGFSLVNVQVQLVTIRFDPDGKPDGSSAKFSYNVDDCVGTFSTGSWMGLVATLVLIAGFIFGYLMLNSVQTGDRFDDPKQKQIVINVRE